MLRDEGKLQTEFDVPSFCRIFLGGSPRVFSNVAQTDQFHFALNFFRRQILLQVLPAFTQARSNIYSEFVCSGVLHEMCCMLVCECHAMCRNMLQIAESRPSFCISRYIYRASLENLMVVLCCSLLEFACLRTK